jgi:hypothetical protein
MSWKYIVILILAFFLVGILSMVYVAHRQTNEMIDDNYYDKELAYQGVIDAKRNMQGLNDSILITESGSVVKVQIPINASKNITESTLEFLRPSDKSMDKIYQIQTDSTGLQTLPKTDFIKGVYRMRARWKSNNIEYFDERDIVLH